MIIVKVVNQKIVQVLLSGQSGQLKMIGVTTRNHKRLANFARTFVQSTSLNQKVTNANNQQLVSIARNISFRQCQNNGNNKANSKLPFSMSAASPTSNFISADLGQSLLFPLDGEEENYNKSSPFESLKRKAKDVVEKRELAAKNRYYGQSFDQTTTTNATERKLVVLMSWLQAQEKHIEKYRQFYLDRGFDVLNVKTTPWDLLLPNIGAKKISKDFVRFMIEKQYSNVVLHGFSVGGFMFGQFLLDIDRQGQRVKDDMINAIRGIVFDSLVPLEGTCVGVANSITSNKIGAYLLENLLKLYLYLGHNIATKHYLDASEKVWGGPLRCPTLFMNSKSDNISDHKIIWRLADTWQDLGVETHRLFVDNSPHVQIFSKHNKAYVEHVEKFLKRLNLF